MALSGPAKLITNVIGLGAIGLCIYLVFNPPEKHRPYVDAETGQYLPSEVGRERERIRSARSSAEADREQAFVGSYDPGVESAEREGVSVAAVFAAVGGLLVLGLGGLAALRILAREDLPSE